MIIDSIFYQCCDLVPVRGKPVSQENVSRGGIFLENLIFQLCECLIWQLENSPISYNINDNYYVCCSIKCTISSPLAHTHTHDQPSKIKPLSVSFTKSIHMYNKLFILQLIESSKNPHAQLCIMVVISAHECIIKILWNMCMVRNVEIQTGRHLA